VEREISGGRYNARHKESRMTIDRRRFLLTAAALATTPPLRVGADGAAGPLPGSVRADFPSVEHETYLNAAAIHPMSAPAAKRLQRYIDVRLNGVRPDPREADTAMQEDLKRRFAAVINATPREIAFVQNTSDAENIVVMGMDLAKRGGNVVLDELHFTTSLYMYKTLEAKGLELRIVKHRDWTIDPADMARAIDKSTRLVSMALVSNVNGFMHNARAVADAAHAHGAYLYADIVQAAGAVPIDVKAMGIDFAGTATYKWLMGERGFGFLYVREDLQGTVLPTTRYGHRQVANFNRAELSWEPLPGAARYETGTIPSALAAVSHESLQYIERLGLANIQAHATRLIGRLQKELPAMGYPSLTPVQTPTPIAAFQLRDAAATAKRLRAGKVAATIIEPERRLRLSVSVFNTDADIDRVLQVLSS
jgi:selenocysteine lyase/cysteine desulfurase